jgi:hypothetical protein
MSDYNEIITSEIKKTVERAEAKWVDAMHDKLMVDVLRKALEPFASALHMTIGFDGTHVYAVLTYPADSDKTICLADFDRAKAVLGEGKE